MSHEAELGAGATSVGGVVSATVTFCVAVAVLPVESVAVYVIVLVPTGKKLPVGTPVRLTLTAPQPLLVVGVPKVASATAIPHAVAADPVFTLIGAGAVM